MSKENLKIGIENDRKRDIGEARTYELLVEDFTILSRSVDWDGTDFLIERFDTNKHINQLDYPRFGRIQSKYRTSDHVEIKYSYMYETLFLGDIPRPDFFLMIHHDEIGESNVIKKRNLYFLTSEEIHNLLTEDYVKSNKSKNIISISITKLGQYLIEGTHDERRASIFKKITAQLDAYDENIKLAYEKVMVLDPDNYPIDEQFEGCFVEDDYNIAENYKIVKKKAFEVSKNVLNLSFNLRFLITERDPRTFYTFIDNEGNPNSETLQSFGEKVASDMKEFIHVLQEFSDKAKKLS
ncbi:hypothetical protein [Bacillus sp. 166amftsu]|uniref:hypothetical protein n=1 Tax=Bacillus sp. 166amftsu TaxID=1761753 RepID=UPI000897B88E|nr:hypothetical protein [Bacillus sp. 166amftsu]SDZ07503.1 hypothetical protein SAMN04488156_105123 [Bacillus sp. 166amftsu]